MLTVGEFNSSSMQEYTNSLEEVLKHKMIGQEIVFRKQVYELHRLYQIQKMLTGDPGCKELDAYAFWKGRLQSPARPLTNLKRYAALAEGRLSRNLAVVSTEFLNLNWFSDCNVSLRDEVDLTLRIGGDTRKICRDNKDCYEKNARSFPHCFFDLEASTSTISQEDIRIASALSYATPITGSKQELQFHGQANTYSAMTDIPHMAVCNSNVNRGKSNEEENSFCLGHREPNSGISSDEASMKGKSFASNESIEFDFDLNKVQSDDSFDLNDPADPCLWTPGSSSPFDKLKGIYSDEGSCSHAASCEKVNGDRLNEPSNFPVKKDASKENLADIHNVEKIEMLEENVALLQPCKSKINLEETNINANCSTTLSVENMEEESLEGDALVQEAAELLFHFSLGSSVSIRDYSTNAGSNLNDNKGSDRPQCSSDSYESLVLKLEETSADDYCVSSKAFEVEEFEKKEYGVMWRRGRRLKDFKGILPNLVSLSRHEIREDVGIMEAVMRSREYKRMRSKAVNGVNWYTPTKCKRSRPRQRYS